MRLNSKVTWGLAWAGLAVVLAVPSADFLTGGFGKGDKAAVLTSDVEPVKPAETASVTTTKTTNGVIITPAGSKTPADPVEAAQSSAKPLPDYISDGKAPTTPDTQVAAIDPAPVLSAPTPFPGWARPRFETKPVAPAATTAPAATISAPVAITTAPAEPAVIVDETTLTGSVSQPAGPVPPAPIVDDSDNWDTESLRQYLENRGILDDGRTDRSSARVTERSTETYDPDGFYLSDGPNGDRETRRERILRLLEESENDPSGFTLF